MPGASRRPNLGMLTVEVPPERINRENSFNIDTGEGGVLFVQWLFVQYPLPSTCGADPMLRPTHTAIHALQQVCVMPCGKGTHLAPRVTKAYLEHRLPM